MLVTMGKTKGKTKGFIRTRVKDSIKPSVLVFRVGFVQSKTAQIQRFYARVGGWVER
jgi:hypothetical protein